MGVPRGPRHKSVVQEVLNGQDAVLLGGQHGTRLEEPGVPVGAHSLKVTPTSSPSDPGRAPSCPIC